MFIPERTMLLGSWLKYGYLGIQKVIPSNGQLTDNTRHKVQAESLKKTGRELSNCCGGIYGKIINSVYVNKHSSLWSGDIS